MKYLRRGIWYVASRLLVICLVLGLIITVFYYTMNLTNIQIILKDGMAARAKYIMGINEDRNELSKFFTTLERDTQITETDQGLSPYANYSIRGIDHRLDMGFFWLWPWDTQTRAVTITERIPRIDGRVKGLKADEMVAQYGADAIYPPSWQEATYKAYLKRENGQWKIINLVLVSNVQ